MLGKYIEEVLSDGGQLVFQGSPFGDQFFVEGKTGTQWKLTRRQFDKFKETCNANSESNSMWNKRGEKQVYYWRTTCIK